MGVRAIRATSALLMSVWLQQCAAGEVRLERGAWPEAMACEACVNFQFGELAMRLPLRLIGRFFVAGSEASAVHLLAPGAANGKNSAVFLSTTRAAYIGKYQALGLPSVNAMGGEAFFDLLGEPAQRDSLFHAIRRSEGIDAAEHYLKTSRSRLFKPRACSGFTATLHGAASRAFPSSRAANVAMRKADIPGCACLGCTPLPI